MPAAAAPAPPAPKPAAAKSSSNAAGKKPAAAAAAPPTSGDEVLDYLRQTCAPTNAQGIAEHFRNAIIKSQAERHLAGLVETGQAVCKESGKIKVFWAAQDGASALGKDEAASLDAQIKATSAEASHLQQQISKQQMVAKAAAKVRTIAEVQAEAKAARAKAEQAEADVAAQRKELGGGGAAMGEAEEAKVRKEYTRLRKIYLERRRTCMEMVGNICENVRQPDIAPVAHQAAYSLDLASGLLSVLRISSLTSSSPPFAPHRLSPCRPSSSSSTTTTTSSSSSSSSSSPPSLLLGRQDGEEAHGGPRDGDRRRLRGQQGKLPAALRRSSEEDAWATG